MVLKRRSRSLWNQPLSARMRRRQMSHAKPGSGVREFPRGGVRPPSKTSMRPGTLTVQRTLAPVSDLDTRCYSNCEAAVCVPSRALDLRASGSTLDAVVGDGAESTCAIADATATSTQ